MGACQDDDTPLLFQFFLYFSAAKMEEDKTRFLYANGFPMTNKSDVQRIQTLLPPGDPADGNKVYILVVIEDKFEGVAFASTSIAVTGYTLPVTMKQIVQLLYPFYLSNLAQPTPPAIPDAVVLDTMSIVVSTLRAQDAFYQKCKNCCSEKGECNFKKKLCTCEAGAALPDCSGDADDQLHLTTMLTEGLANLTSVRTAVATAQQASGGTYQLYEYLQVEKVYSLVAGAPFMRQFASTMDPAVITS